MMESQVLKENLEIRGRWVVQVVTVKMVFVVPKEIRDSLGHRESLENQEEMELWVHQVLQEHKLKAREFQVLQGLPAKMVILVPWDYLDQKGKGVREEIQVREERTGNRDNVAYQDFQVQIWEGQRKIDKDNTFLF